jgi:hydrogenase maturation factor
VLGGLFELSSACGSPVVVALERIHVPEEASAVCAAFGLDPLTTTSEGTLVITCKRGAVEDIRAALAEEKVECYEVGHVGPRSLGKGLWVSSGGSKPEPQPPGSDAYWDAYSHAVDLGLK